MNPVLISSPCLLLMVVGFYVKTEAGSFHWSERRFSCQAINKTTGFRRVFFLCFLYSSLLLIEDAIDRIFRGNGWFLLLNLGGA
jgi:hypothetical protein